MTKQPTPGVYETTPAPVPQLAPSGWLCSAGFGEGESARIDTDAANVQRWRDQGYVCTPYWFSPPPAPVPHVVALDAMEIELLELAVSRLPDEWQTEGKALLEKVRTPSPQPREADPADDMETLRQEKINERRINIRNGYGD